MARAVIDSLSCCLTLKHTSSSWEGKMTSRTGETFWLQGFPPQEDLAHPTQCRGTNQNRRTSLGGLELKSPFACLEQDNLSDTSCCELCPLGHTCYCVTACLKNVGCRGRENDCNPICTNNLRTSLCESFYRAVCP